MMRNLSVPYLALALAATSACQVDESDAGDEYRKGIPNQSTIEVQVPGATGQALSVAGAGKVSEYYRLTRVVSRDVNAGVYIVLNLVRDVVHYPPTAVTANTAVWGPFSEALDPIAWRVTVTRAAPNDYAYKFEGQAKANPASGFETVLSGVHRPALGAGGAASPRGSQEESPASASKYAALRQKMAEANERTIRWISRNIEANKNP
jgi:hypothetical protein